MSDEVRLRTLRPGDGFAIKFETTDRILNGYLVEVNSGSATVEVLDRAAGGRQYWWSDTLVVPDGTTHESKSKSPAEPAEGEAEMATKKVAKVKKERAVPVFEINAERARAFRDGKYVEKDEKGKYVADGANGKIIQVLLEKKKLPYDELLSEVLKAGFKTKRKEPRIYGYLRKLVAARVLSRTNPA